MANSVAILPTSLAVLQKQALRTPEREEFCVASAVPKPEHRVVDRHMPRKGLVAMEAPGLEAVVRRQVFL